MQSNGKELSSSLLNSATTVHIDLTVVGNTEVMDGVLIGTSCKQGAYQQPWNETSRKYEL